MEEIKRILILRYEHIGDYIITLPALKALREKFPNAKIDIVVGPWNKELVKATPYVDEAIIFDNPLIRRNISRISILKEIIFNRKKYFQLFEKLNRKKYDLLINFSNRKTARFFTKNILARNKVSAPNENESTLEIDRCLKVVEQLDIKTKRSFVKLNYRKKDLDKINSIITRYNLGERRIILAHLITPSKGKDWPIERWKKVFEKILSKGSVSIILLGVKEDKSLLEDFKKQFGNKIINVAGDLNLVQTKLLIEKADFFIGAGSGPLYLADISGIPTLGLLGPESSLNWNLFNKKSHQIRKNNMIDIKVFEVLEKVGRILNNIK